MDPRARGDVMNKPDPGSVLGPSPTGSTSGPASTPKQYAVTLIATSSGAGRPLFESALAIGGPIQVSFSSDGSPQAGVVTGTLTFTSPGNNITIVSSTCDQLVLAAGQSCTLTFAVTPAATTAGKVRTPPATVSVKLSNSVLKAEMKGL